jgi:Gas vesicle synthesis protein GvpL/GvpF
MAPRVKPNDKVLYLYGVTRNTLTPVPRVAAVDGAAVLEPLDCGGLVCWISRVARSEYADNLSANMENLDWLAEASVRHQRVVAAIAQQTEILPARFGTVFLTKPSLEADIQSRRKTLESDFRKIKDSDEWGVKVFGVQPRVAIPKSSSRTGKDYLKAKAALLQRRPTKGTDADLIRFEEELKRVAVDTAVGGKISSGQRGLQWQTSLLLRRDDRKRFEALLKKFSKEWADVRQIEATGPWPPYSFVSREDNKQ